jgi:hypothetical protein
MATPFSRTIHSLQIDNYYTSLAGLLVAKLLLVMWGYWFFTAKITFFESSQAVSVTGKEFLTHQFPKADSQVIRVQVIRERLIIAEFPSESSETIKVGQAAFIRLDGKVGKKTGIIPATVVNIIHPVGQEKETVVLRAGIDAAAPNPFKEGRGGEVKIEVEHLTPATLVLRASGLQTETAPVSYSSQ